MTRSEALKIRKLIEKASAALGDADASEAPLLFPRWRSGEGYDVGNRVCHNGELYKCIMTHVSQSDWEPQMAPSLFVKVADPMAEYPEWVRPAGAHDAYEKGAKVSHNGKKWISTADVNVWEPGVSGWEEVQDE
ncbi:MAG: alpha-amlyase [Ruminococcaceae bacterium]|nr:alpha-amlyase [Oscillospiraceae bacterium]